MPREQSTTRFDDKSRYQPYSQSRNDSRSNSKPTNPSTHHYHQDKSSYDRRDQRHSENRRGNDSYERPYHRNDDRMDDRPPKANKMNTTRTDRPPINDSIQPPSSTNKTTPEESTKPNIYQTQRDRNTSKYGKSQGDEEDDFPAQDDESLELMKRLGLPTAFNTTHEKQVPGNNLSGVKITRQRKVRQVMNLKDKPTHDTHKRF